jgi:hypothetical protein
MVAVPVTLKLLAAAGSTTTLEEAPLAVKVPEVAETVKVAVLVV